MLACGVDETVEEDQFADEELTFDDVVVHLSSESGEVLPLRASFMSDNRTMSYTFDYDGNLLKLMDTKYSGASEFGASFYVDGGAEITTATYVKEGFIGPQTRSDGECMLDYATVEGEGEYLVLQLRVCEEGKVDLAERAMNELLEGLTMEVL